MSKYDYDSSRQIVADDPPFYALVMAAMRRADSGNLDKLRSAFPEIYDELQERYDAPGGVVPSDAMAAEQ